MDSLERLQGLHADLQAFTETRLANVDRLWQELEDSVQEFRKLLDKPTPSAADREAYTAGKLSVGEQEYGISDEFRHLSRAVGTALELDEVEAGRLLVEGNTAQPQDDTYIVADAVSRFHDRRDLVLQTLRVALEESLNLDQEDQAQFMFRNIVADVLDISTGPPSNGSAFALKCLKALEDVESWSAKISEQLQSKNLLSQMRGPEFYATLEFQRSSLFKQHECLGALLALLFKGNYTTSEDVRKLHAVVKRWQRMDLLWVHYLPAFSASFRQYGSSDGAASIDDSKSLDRAIASVSSENNSSLSRPLQAVLDLWWTVEFSAWSREPAQSDADSDKQAKIVKTALEDHALEALLAICSSIHPEMWRHPARQELISLLIGDNSGLSFEVDQQTSPFFYTMLMESIEAFAEAWVTNMPDSIRLLKNKEDEERLLQITGAQDALHPGQRDRFGRMHLESFLVVIAFAFEHRREAAEQFWEDPDGNLYGFLQWSSKRQTVPRVSAFCEMLCAISEGPENAAAAHKFLLDESVVVPTSRTRRVPTMNYNQILAELELYARRVHERVPTPQSLKPQGPPVPELNEVESPVMLASYLRLLAHLSRHYGPTREHILINAGFDFPKMLLMLASGPIPSYLRATIFRALESLLTDKTDLVSADIWKALDEWASSSHDVNAVLKQNAPPERSLSSLQATLSSIAASFDQYDAFLDLLRALVAPTPATAGNKLPLPFSSDLGSSYRAPGIAPYVDFVCGQIFTKRLRELSDETQKMLCAYHCLDFVAICLEGFNESYIALLDRSAKMQENLTAPNQDLVYARCHPFARVMQWLFGADMNRSLLSTLHGRVPEVESAIPDAPVVLTTLRNIDVINLVLDLQPTYFDLVKPMLKDGDNLKGIVFAGFSSFEESVAAHSEVLLDLCQYAVTPHLQLALRSLALLQKLTGSSKLNNYLAAEGNGKSRRLIEMLGPVSGQVLTRVAEDLVARCQLDIRELEDGFEASGYLMKDGCLAFLNACLGIQPNLPSVAHLLLGFGRIHDSLTITQPMDDGVSLFNAITDLVVEYPDGRDGDLISWLIHIKAAGLRVLQHLWTSSVSSEIALGQLRRFNFLSLQFANQTIVSQSTVWDGNTISDAHFWHTTSAEALTEFLTSRACLYDYAAREINSMASEKLISLQRQLISTLQGKSIAADGGVQAHLTIFDLFDFADLDMTAALQMPTLAYFTSLNSEKYKVEATETMPELYDLAVVRELLYMVRIQLLDPTPQTPNTKTIDPDDLEAEADVIIGHLEARNRWAIANKVRNETLHNYVDMIVSAVENVSVESGSKTQFILHILRVILPKLDVFVAEEAIEAFELARAADALLLVLARDKKSATHAHIDDVIAERLFQLFRICLEGIPTASTSIELRTLLYSICSQYLNRISSPESVSSDLYQKARSNSMDCVRSASQKLVTIIADDAEDASDTCRLNALSLLSTLSSLALSQKSNLVVDALVKNNVIEIMLEPLRSVVSDFASTGIKQRPYLLTIFEARAFLLLQISRTRSGAIALLDSGLLQAYRDSMIFRADPDLGMDLETSITSTLPVSAPVLSQSTASTSRSSALHNYFTLLSSALRVLMSTFSSRGLENEQIVYQMRAFLTEHRANMVGVFKKAAGVNGLITDNKTRALVDDCVKCYTGLIVGCGFVDFEDESTFDGVKAYNGFS